MSAWKQRAWRKDTKEWDNGVAVGMDGKMIGCNHPEDFEFTRYTGLKDKNGVEIYEGDILQHYSAGYHFGVFAVRWDDNGFWDYGISTESSEVIGNIYENPEMLGDTI